MTFEILSSVTPWLVTFLAVAVVGVGLAVYAVVDVVRERAALRRPVAGTRGQREVRGRLALHH